MSTWFALYAVDRTMASLTPSTAIRGAVVCGFLSALCGAVRAQSGPRLTTDAGTITVHVGDRLLARYRFEPNPFKPYLEQFLTPSGINVLRDAPSDHLHHHGMMFAIAVNGLNFWEERTRPGLQRSRETPQTQTRRRNNLSCACIDQDIDWTDPQSKKLHLREHRTLEFYAGDDLSVGLLTWQSRFTTGPGTESATLGGSEYFGLGVRFPASMDKDGHFQTAGGKIGVDATHRSRSRWCAYTAKAEGKLITFALFDHPDNVRHPAKWFAMGRDSDPFAYLSATLNLHERPLEVIADRALTLRYGGALWDGAIQANEIEKVYRLWVDLASAGDADRSSAAP